jgi:hypothetical protein
MVTVEPEVPSGQARHKVYRHPDRDRIEALLRRGKSSYWISLWLEEIYPVTDEPENDDEATESAANEKMLLTVEELDSYRDEWMPDAAPGVDVVHDQIDDIVGRRFPGSSKGKDFELELLDMSMDVAQHMLGQALEQDDKLKMGVSETTISAHTTLMATLKASVDLKQQLGVRGYDMPVARSKVESTVTNKNLNVNLHGVVDPRTGELGPTDPGRVNAVLELLKAGPERAREVLDQTTVNDDQAEGPGPGA